MRGKRVGFGFAEHVGIVTVLLRNMREVGRFVGDGSGPSGDDGVGEGNPKALRARKFTSTRESGCTYHGDTRSGDGGFRGFRRNRRILRRERSSPCRRCRSRSCRVKQLWTENDTAQYPVNQRIVVGEPVESKNHGARRIQWSHIKDNRHRFTSWE